MGAYVPAKKMVVICPQRRNSFTNLRVEMIIHCDVCVTKKQLAFFYYEGVTVRFQQLQRIFNNPSDCKIGHQTRDQKMIFDRFA